MRNPVSKMIAVWALVLLVVAGAIGLAVFAYLDSRVAPPVGAVAPIAPRDTDLAALKDAAADELMPISEEEAIARNAQLPFSTEPVEAALPFELASYGFPEDSLARAEECLATAVYYEAGFQKPREKRAVAQVILNRVRHPAFPSSICDVVYQGAERRTGCQFTFTCDGSMRRRPQTAAWLAARAVAEAALSGQVEPSVGMATHFHADYVLPYWAPNLTKIEQVGTHIFYRWNGGWGRRAAFRFDPVMEDLGEMSQLEEAATAQEAGEGAGLPVIAVPRSNILADEIAGLAEEPPTPIIQPEASGGLLADTNRSTLREDEKGRLAD